jgi:hypothetical protein
MDSLELIITSAGGAKAATRALAVSMLTVVISIGLVPIGNRCWASGNDLTVTSTPSQSPSPIQLAQGGAGAPAAGAAVGGGVGTPSPAMGTSTAEEGWLSGLHISGFLSQTFGMWQNPTTLRDFTPSRNNLAVARTLLQVDENYRLNENNSFFMREWFVYEPPYSYDSANNSAYAAGSRLAGNAASFGHFMNDFYNQYTVRDAWWQNKTGPLTTFIGNQIVVWGQSIAFRVGDVINPQDTTWAFGFANLEQSRIPQWMVHPILNLPDLGPFSSNFIEGVLIPRYQPQWSWDYADGRYFDEMGVAGSVNQGFPAAMHGPSARFDVHYPDQFYAGRTALANPLTETVLGPFGPSGAGLVSAPFSKEFYWCSNLGSSLQPFNPVPRKAQRRCTFTPDQTVHFGPVAGASVIDIGQWKIPAATAANWEEGVRLHTLLGPWELTSFYFNTWDYYPSFFWQAFTNQWRARFMPVQYFGVTADAPLPLPASIAEHLPAVGRAEVVYANHQPYADFDPFDLASVRYSDTVDMMYAIDVSQAYAPWLTKTGNLSMNLEVQDYITMDASQNMLTAGAPFGGVGGDLNESVNKNEVNLLFNVGTSWWWNDFAPTWTMIFNPKGRTFLLFPSLVLNPPWTKAYFLKLGAIEVLGGDVQSIGGGLFKGESLLTAQFQYNFNVM